ncbi:TIGR03086 family metal-binding protein [Streptomyces sp. H10-C2]|uniref:TIGR03086 family metal-binding protein n=1 Tax=unclassified Streptomyces TaxID=2593676 RepID=UPI0024BB22FC|nr:MULTISPECIES: TIGR03086 family metal-binding protein [unclassified Streptomyces]MDJ0343594.1 TIGR03086 family metal-binding protein [Streptomyces sp. PH10-H1]MDJ0373158.1 TIGR03086 family metal-binding protein [Streptomyces sp. H10-C2]
MARSTDPLALLSRSLDQTSALIASVTDDQLSLPTPCRSWTVAELVDHLIQDLPHFTERANGGTPARSEPRKDAGAGRPEAFRDGAAELVSAWRRAGDLTGTIEIPGMGELPAGFPVDQQLTEFAVHAWDLAKALGRPTSLDSQVGESALEWARGALRPEFRGEEGGPKVFGPEVPVRPDAPVYDRLAGFFGRDPGTA